MPSLPTSLIVVGLVIAWLVVLVPMVSRRREEVPENNEEGARFRVLRREAGSRRRRPVLSRTAMMRPADDGNADDLVDDEVRDLNADDEAAPATGSAVSATDTGSGRQDVVSPVAAEVAGSGLADGTRTAEFSAAAVSSTAAVSAAAADAFASADADAGAIDSDGEQASGDVMSDGGDDMAWRDADGTRVARTARGRDDVRGQDDRPARYAAAASGYGEGAARYGEPAQLRRTPIRPGRGGFDPAAADRARAYRFRQRRRVASVLALVTIAGVVVGVMGPKYGYIGAVGGGVLLVLYLAYLRRQVRIEEEILRRRSARLERARQIRPGYRPSVAEQVYAHRTGTMPEPGTVGDYQVKSHVRQPVSDGRYGPEAEAGRRYGEVLDLDDSDPAFDDLEYYRPAAYTRRAG